MQKTSFIMILSIIIFFSSLLVNEINEKQFKNFLYYLIQKYSYIH